MRLLDTAALRLTDFLGEVPAYAILSHRWEDEEVAFEDMKPGGRAVQMKGYAKLKDAARLARYQGYGYIWIDTCCIDKSSSAELSEAINSMFQWYENSAICFAYLSDVSPRGGIHNSQWFKRGWTLQELIAPKHVHFYDATWQFLGSKRDLKDQLRSITGIAEDVLLGASLSTVPASSRMCWAADRVTTRPEDMAYCLMGLLNVSMPLLYGEGGEKAFKRLQEAFIRESDDESIFAWTADPAEAAEKPFWGLLAASPSYFKSSAGYAIPRFKTHRDGTPTEITNHGLRISLTLQPVAHDGSETLFQAPLNCSSPAHDGREVRVPFVLMLQQLSGFEEQYARVRPDVMMPINFESPEDAIQNLNKKAYNIKTSQVFVRPVPREEDPAAGFYIKSTQSLKINMLGLKIPGIIISDVLASFSCDAWQKVSQLGRMFDRFVDLTAQNSGFDARDFDVRSLRQRKAVGCIEIQFQSTRAEENRFISDHQRKPTYLIVGFEPLPSNFLGTPPGFVQPWYSFSVHDNWRKFTHESILAPFWSVPGCGLVKVYFTTITHMFKTFYEINLTGQ